MKEYVDIEILKQQDFQDFSNTDVMHAIDNCPRVDVEPVQRGRWIEHADQSVYINGEKQIVKYCSVCGEAAPYNAIGRQFYPVRCYCGAKMNAVEGSASREQIDGESEESKYPYKWTTEPIVDSNGHWTGIKLKKVKD